MSYEGQPPAYTPAPPAYNTTAYTPAPVVVTTTVPTYQNQDPNAPLLTTTYDSNHHHHHGQPQHWGEVPQRHYCQFCGNHVVTEVIYETGTLTWLVSGGMVLVGCFLGCCLFPFCIDSLKDPVHICPACHNVVGKRRRI